MVVAEVATVEEVSGLVDDWSSGLVVVHELDEDWLGVSVVPSVGSSPKLSELSRILLFFGSDSLGPVVVGLSADRLDFLPLPFPLPFPSSFSGVAPIGVDVARGGDSGLFRFLVFFVSFASS